MDQLHEELKEPLTECSMSGEGSDGEERGDGERSPSEDEFLSCDSGSSSDRGEVGGSGEGELLMQDECDGVRSSAGGIVGVSPAGVISEKERLKERRVSGSPLRGGSQEMDEDADVDTAAEGGAPERAVEEECTSNPNTEVQSQENNQPSNTEQGQGDGNNTSGNNKISRIMKTLCQIIYKLWIATLIFHDLMKNRIFLRTYIILYFNKRLLYIVIFDHMTISFPEPDNEASMTQPQSTPCSPVRTLQELHPKLSSSPPRSSPLRSAGPAYSFKKGVETYGDWICTFAPMT